MSRGWVYVLDNPSMPGRVKIGFTERIPDMRANELDATGVPTPFDLQFTALVDRAFELEQAVHAAMDANRVRQNREWFDLTVDEAIEAIRSSASAMGLSLLFEDDRFSDGQATDDGDVSVMLDPNDVAKTFIAYILKDDLHKALGILKSILSDSLEYAKEFFDELQNQRFILDDEMPRYAEPGSDSGKLALLSQIELITGQRRELPQRPPDFNKHIEKLEAAGLKRATDILAKNAILEAQIFSILFRLSRPNGADSDDAHDAIKFLWELFPKRRQVLIRWIDELVEKVFSSDLRIDRVQNASDLAMMLIELHRIDKAIEILQYTAPIIPQFAGKKYGMKWGFVLPIGAILSTSSSTQQLDALIQKLLLVPEFVNCLVSSGFPRKYQYPEHRISDEKKDKDGFVVTNDIYKIEYTSPEYLLSSQEDLDRVIEFITALANKTQWRNLIGEYDGNTPSDDAVYEQAVEELTYEQVAEEMSANNIKQGLWTKAYAKAGGDEKATKAQYIKLRVEQITRDSE